MSVESVVSKSKRKNIGDKTKNEDTLAETEGPGGEGNDMGCMCREGVRRVGAAQTGAAQTWGMRRGERGWGL